MKDIKEADIVISGVKLTEAQSMTLRVALNSWLLWLEENGLGDDENGRALADGYHARGIEILKLMHKTCV